MNTSQEGNIAEEGAQRGSILSLNLHQGSVVDFCGCTWDVPSTVKSCLAFKHGHCSDITWLLDRRIHFRSLLIWDCPEDTRLSLLSGHWWDLHHKEWQDGQRPRWSPVRHGTWVCAGEQLPHQWVSWNSWPLQKQEAAQISGDTLYSSFLSVVFTAVCKLGDLCFIFRKKK